MTASLLGESPGSCLEASAPDGANVQGPTAAPGPADAQGAGWPQTPREFEAVVDAYLVPLVRYAARRLGNVHDAEDVAQEVFVRTFADRSKPRAVTQMRPYLYRAVANACADFARKRRAVVVSLEEINTESLRAQGKNPAEAAIAAEEARRAEELLKRLPEEQAEAIRLRVFGEFRLREIAKATLCSVDTVASRLRYGFKKLREIVSRERG